MRPPFLKKKAETAMVVAAPPIPFTVDILAGHLRESSLKMYKRDFGAYLKWAKEEGLPPLEVSTFYRWIVWLPTHTEHSPNTINRMLSAVRRLVLEAAKQNYLNHEQAKAFEQAEGVKTEALKERLKPHARTRISPEEMRRLCDTPDAGTPKGLRDRALLHTLASSGVRVAEVATLTTSQVIRKEQGYLLLVRGKNDLDYREAYLSQEAYRCIAQWLQACPFRSQWLFPGFSGRGNHPLKTDRAMTPQAIWKLVQTYAQACGLEHIKPHDFRRFLGTRLARQDIRKAQRALGHKRIDTTARHYDLNELEPGLTDNLY